MEFGQHFLGCNHPDRGKTVVDQSPLLAAASTSQFADISHYQSPFTLPTGAPALLAKSTEGSSYSDPAYKGYKTQAANKGAVFVAYHFLWSASAAEVQHVYNVVGKTPLMLDCENTSVKTTVAMITSFVTQYRKLGGVVHMVYLPQWYWSGHLGSPSLAPLKNANLALVSSYYTTYSASGPGWNSYGGVTPHQWQFTDHKMYSGEYVDFNAYKGTKSQYKTLVTSGPNAAPKPPEADLDYATFKKYMDQYINETEWGNVTDTTGKSAKRSLKWMIGSIHGLLMNLWQRG